MVFLLTLECFVFVMCQGSSVFFLFALGGLRSLLRAVLICLCAAFDGYVTMVDWMSCICSGLSVFVVRFPT